MEEKKGWGKLAKTYCKNCSSQGGSCERGIVTNIQTTKGQGGKDVCSGVPEKVKRPATVGKTKVKVNMHPCTLIKLEGTLEKASIGGGKVFQEEMK